MTLIAAWRTPAGIVIHADSQETCGDYRCEVNKIKAETMGQFQVLVAGAGSPGTLVDAFAIRLQRSINDSVSTIEHFAAIAEKELGRFYRKEVSLCPDTDKNVSYLIAASHPETRRYEAWRTSSIYIDPIPSDVPSLMGWEWQLYVSIAKRLYSRDMTIPQAILAGVYLQSIAEETSNYVKSPISIAVVDEAGIVLEDKAYARKIEDRIKAFESQINKVFLACTDTTVSSPSLEDSLNRFRQAALDLHRDHIDELARKAGVLDFAHGNPLRKLPFVPMRMLDAGGFAVEHDRETIERNDAEKNANAEWVKEHGIEFLKQTVHCSNCGQEFDAEMPCRGPHAHTLTTSCPHCNEAQLVRWKAF